MILKDSLNLSLLAIAVGCGGPLPTSSGTGTRSVAEATALFKKAVSEDDVQSMAFKPTGARVGLQDYYSYQTPVVFLTLPLQSDFVEIMRCPNEISVLGASKQIDIRAVDIGYGFLEQKEIFQTNDFWTAGLNAGCGLVSSGVVEENYFDAFAPDGLFFYMLRACVVPEKVQDRKPTEPLCGRAISTTSKIRYANARTHAQTQKLREAQKLSDKAFGLTRQGVKLAAQLYTELQSCSQAHNLQAKKKSIFDWLQTGLGWMKTFFPVFNIALPIDVAKTSAALLQMKELFAIQQIQLPASCQFAAEIQKQGEILSSEMEATQKMYLQVYQQIEDPSSTGDTP